MNIVNFPPRKGGLRPVVELYTPDQTESGLHEVWLWRSRDRDEGFIYRVQTMQDAEKLVATIKDTFPGRWSRG